MWNAKMWKWLLPLVVLAACSSSSSSTTAVCVSGSSNACACTNGLKGAQTCLKDGSGYAVCLCSASDAGLLDAGTGPDVDASFDAGTDAFDPQKTLDQACDPTRVPADSCAELFANMRGSIPTCQTTHTDTPHDEYGHCVLVCLANNMQDQAATIVCGALGGVCVAPLDAGGTTAICVPQ